MSEATDTMGGGFPPVDEEARGQQIQAAMEAEPGAIATEQRQQSYYGAQDEHQWYFPDNISFITFIELNEGGRQKYVDAAQSDARLQRGSGDMLIKMQASKAKMTLFNEAIVGWNVIRPDGSKIPFSKNSEGSELWKYIRAMPPRLVDALEEAIREKNPWLLQDMDLEDIDKEIENLQKMREQKVAQDQGKSS